MDMGRYLARKLKAKKFDFNGEEKLMEMSLEDVEPEKFDEVEYDTTFYHEGREIHLYTYDEGTNFFKDYDRIWHDYILRSESVPPGGSAIFRPEEEKNNIEVPVAFDTVYYDEGDRYYDKKSIVGNLYDLFGSGNYHFYFMKGGQSEGKGPEYIIKRVWISPYGPEEIKKRIGNKIQVTENA